MVLIENTRVEKQRDRLIKLLKELFQLDQPDLDFGFYKIMHAKADKVSEFLQYDLLKIIREAFGEADEARVEEARLAYEAAVKQATEFGAPDPEATEPVRKAKASYEAVKDIGNNEGEIYEHLYRFFERYYDNGDFMSRRYFARETESKAAPFSVPYDGREVYLHWANRDQYYIKTSEYLTNFTFDLSQTPELKGQLFEQQSLKVHCRIAEASEGEHNNVKANDKTERFFVIHEKEPVKMEGGDLVLQFEYRPDPDKSGKASKWQETRLDEAEQKILHALTGLRDAASFNEALRTQIGDEYKRSLLRKYINRYTGRNTMDYFIHKDLGGFLKRELDFYIKNEIMRLDDIESADAPRVESYLAKIRVLRKIAGHLITFLAQLEEFQKKLWLKKKFVTETQYCITLDRIPEAFYPEIADNEAQTVEWVKLFAIDELEDYSTPLTIDFLKANPFMVLDTAFFSSNFKDRLLADMQDLDETTDGLLIHSENSQAFNVLANKFDNTVDYIYADPPYNTSENSFIYKNSYKHSSWGTMLFNTIDMSRNLMKHEGVFSSTIDDLEQPFLSNICDDIFGSDLRLGNLVIEIKPSGRTNDNYFATSHEYVLFYAKNFGSPRINLFDLTEEQKQQYSEGDGEGSFKWRDFLRTGGFSTPEERPNSHYPIYYDPKTQEISLENKGNDFIEILPIDSEGKKRVWRKTPPSFWDHVEKNEIKIEKNRQGVWKVKIIDKIKEGVRPKSVWTGSRYDASSHGTKLLKNIFGESNSFSFPKSIYAVKDCIHVASPEKAMILDGFSGSGTTGHAVVDLNRENEDSQRKFILIEMGNYFYESTRPRIQKVIYSKEWKNGKPVSRDGISHAFKYMRLETYEDALNNLAFQDNSKRDQVLAKSDEFRRDYMLKYWIDFGTKDSPSLLNIDLFADPCSYKLKIKKPGSDEYDEKNIDLIETFNWLIGLHVDHIDAWRSYTASFKREEDPELPKDENTRLILDGRMEESASGKWWFRKVEGRVCRTPGDKSNMDRVLIIWRKLTGNLEEDNLMLDEWFKKYRLSTQDTEFDVIYVNCSNNLPNLRQDVEYWKVRLIEETFHQKMWDVEG